MGIALPQQQDSCAAMQRPCAFAANRLSRRIMTRQKEPVMTHLQRVTQDATPSDIARPDPAKVSFAVGNACFTIVKARKAVALS